MTDLLAARALFGLSLAFHIVFAAVGVAMPLLMVLAEWRWRRAGSEVHLELARRWAKATAILFAVGAVSGTVLSFELGLLWPRFMEFAGPIIGMPFSLEGFAFFAEAIFLGIYLYGWERCLAAPAPRQRRGGGRERGALGLLRDARQRLDEPPRRLRSCDAGAATGHPSAARRCSRPAGPTRCSHVLLSCYVATAFARGGDPRLRRCCASPRAPSTARRSGSCSAVGAVGGAPAADLRRPLRAPGRAAPAAQARGDGGALRDRARARRCASAASRTGAPRDPLRAGDPPRPLAPRLPRPHRRGEGARGLPARGLAQRPKRPPRLPGDGGAGDACSRSSPPRRPRCGVAQACRCRAGSCGSWSLGAPAGFLALEAGWLVTEWGRQPYSVWGVLRTADAVTPVASLAVPLVLFTLLYLVPGGHHGRAPAAPDPHAPPRRRGCR